MLDLASDLIGRHMSEKDFRSHFGGPSIAVEKLWSMINIIGDLPHSWGIDEFFMCLFFLQHPESSWSTNASRWGIHPNTFKKHLMESLQLIINALPEVKII